MAAPATARLNHTARQLAIAYNPGLMESIRRSAQNGFNLDLPVVMGVLVGRRLSTGLSVTSWMLAVDSDLARAIEFARHLHTTDEVLGWFRTKHQGEARLTTAELEAAHHVFGELPPLALVFRPSGQRPLRVAAYLTDADGHWAGERPLQEYFVESPEIAAPLSPFAAPRPRQTLPSRTVRQLWALGAILLTTIVALLIVQYRSPPAKPAPARLWVESVGTQRTLHWRVNSDAQRASLTIRRGTKSETIPLLASQFVLASYVLPPETPGDDMVLLFRVEGAQVSDSRLRLVAAPAPPPPVAPKSPGHRRRRR